MHLEKMTRKEAAEHLGGKCPDAGELGLYWQGKKSLFISWGAKCCICALISMLILHPLAERRRCKGGVMAQFDRIIREAECSKLTGVSRTTRYELEKKRELSVSP